MLPRNLAFLREKKTTVQFLYTMAHTSWSGERTAARVHMTNELLHCIYLIMTCIKFWLHSYFVFFFTNIQFKLHVFFLFLHKRFENYNVHNSSVCNMIFVCRLRENLTWRQTTDTLKRRCIWCTCSENHWAKKKPKSFKTMQITEDEEGEGKKSQINVVSEWFGRVLKQQQKNTDKSKVHVFCVCVYVREYEKSPDLNLV